MKSLKRSLDVLSDGEKAGIRPLELPVRAHGPPAALRCVLEYRLMALRFHVAAEVLDLGGL